MKWHKTNQMAKWPNGFYRNCENVRSRAVCSSCKIWLQINAKWGARWQCISPICTTNEAENDPGIWEPPATDLCPL